MGLARHFISNLGKLSGRSSIIAVLSAELPQDPSKQAHHAPQIGFIGHQAAEENAEGFAVCGADSARRVVDGFHGFFDEEGKAIELTGVGALLRTFDLLEWVGCGGLFVGSSGDFVKGDGYGLAEVHGGLVVVGVDDDERVAPGKVIGGQAVFF